MDGFLPAQGGKSGPVPESAPESVSASEPVRIAMWSGPRSISTAMMRSFESRADCCVSDEPFYGHFLASTGAAHPMREDIMASMECRFDRVAAAVCGPAPGGAAVWYQKHMTHHIAPGDSLSWSAGFRHAFLIRHPRAVAASYAAKRENPDGRDIGVRRQLEIYEAVTAMTGAAPPVADTDQILADPRRALRALCAALDIPFDEAMLSWPPGRRASDGVWAAHWYGAAEASAGFGPPKPPPAPMAPHLEDLAASCMDAYETMRARRLPV